MDSIGDDRFSIKYDVKDVNGVVVVSNVSINFFNDEDEKFNEIYSNIDYEEREGYRKSLEIDEELTEEARIKFLKACIYNGNTDLLVELEELLKGTDEEDTITFANYNNGTGVMSEGNRYVSKAYYVDEFEKFPKKEIVRDVVSNMKLGNAMYGEDIVEVESNCDNSILYDIPNIADFVSEYRKDNLDFSEYYDVYKYDLDNDGLDEILLYSVSGSGRYVSWHLLHLNSNGEITHCNTGSGDLDRYGLKLYKKGEDYFFRSLNRNNVFVVDRDNKVYDAIIDDRYRYYTYIFSDVYNGFSRTILYNADDFICNYRAFSSKPVGFEVEADEDVLGMFKRNEKYRGNIFGKMDINNDGVEDYTFVMTDDSDRFGYYYDFEFVDGKTGELSKVDKLGFHSSGRLCIAYVEEFDDKNYLVTMREIGGNYIFKVFDIQGTEAVVVGEYLYSKIDDIVVDFSVYDYEGKFI